MSCNCGGGTPKKWTEKVKTIFSSKKSKSNACRQCGGKLIPLFRKWKCQKCGLEQ